MKAADKRTSYNYARFASMMLISFVLMYAIMFINVFELDHIRLSLNRTYMALLMVCPMAVTMMGFMWKMYGNVKINRIIIVSAVALFAVSLFMLRTQTPIGDVQWMKGMIPHHSSAIMTSTNADIQNPRVKELSEEIIRSQEREIAQMKALIKELEAR